MNRMFLPSVRETYSDHQSLVELSESRRRLLEEFRGLYTAVLARMDRDRGIVLGVSSPMHGEGKTTVATNIAGAMAADLEKRVLLVSSVFHPADRRTGERPGLAEYLADPARSLEELLVPTPLPNLHVLFAGAAPDNPSRLLRGERMRRTVTELRERFDITVVDLPPVLRASDTQVLAGMMDGILLVVGVGATSIWAAERAVKMLAGANLVGIAANRAQSELPQWLARWIGGNEWVA
ncbi:MAG: CpsD/CapB family tyrosine-protein kinase [Armatimonadetes bacterium]|nr:CpsD/CapB family tyrosine-protein kinase [Armatimonadota bacterium]